jgi:glycosyltransferase involved in cell wall biosynthesis
MSELVSILIPVFNRENLIKETLESALSQNYQNIEVIVVDNASTDNTWQVIKSMSKIDSRVKLFRNDSNIGPVRNWKRCIDDASGVYAKILWSDDLIHPDYLIETLPIIKSDSDIGFVYSAVEIFDEYGENKVMFQHSESTVISSQRYISELLFEQLHPRSPGCALFRLSDLKNNLVVHIPNNVNSDFSMHAIGSDSLLFLLTANNYSKIGYTNKVLSRFRAHTGSISESSTGGKLQLHYLLSDSYFIENYRSDLIKRNNAKIIINLFRFSKGSKKFGLTSVASYYQKNKKLMPSTTQIIKILLSRFFK